jgi:hypothetical protein
MSAEFNMFDFVLYIESGRFVVESGRLVKFYIQLVEGHSRLVIPVSLKIYNHE